MENKTKTIAVLYFALASLSLLMLLFIPVHYKIMSTMMNMDFPIKEGQPYPKEMFSQMAESMKYVYIIMGFVGALFTAISLTTGICMFRKTNRTLCIIGAGVCSVLFPFGTALGIWALLILFDEKTKSEFGG